MNTYGLTTVLTASLRLQPCATYHIRIVIADVGDNNYDSAVLLEAGSFELGGSVSLQSNGPDTATNSIIYEGCENGGFRVTRGADSDPSLAQTIAYRFGANSEAREGVDFINPGGSLTIPAGQTFVDVPIRAIADGVEEGPESIWVILDIPCACYSDSVMITLREPAPLSLTLADAYYCPDQTVVLSPTVSGGSPPYQFNWNTGDSVANPHPSADPCPPAFAVSVTSMPAA
ncbi:MAG: hypothetical protein HC821_01005 [Lewinella sp.]|nr:hypothetical protein [Lewinella sp.]